MLQFYFLSVLLNCIAGLVLALGKGSTATLESVDSPIQSKNSPDIFENRTFKLVIGILTCFTAIIKLLSAFPGSVPVIGDLIPAAAGLLGGAALLIDYYLGQESVESKLNPKLENLFIANKKYIGILCIVAALLHFLFPKVVIL